jgi:uncharacterized protein (TIGR02246 family)
LPLAAIAVLLTTTTLVHAQTKSDETTVQNLPGDFCAAFNRHDGHRLAQLMADDVDFVTVGATWLRGKSDFETYHTRLLNGRFHGMTLGVLQTAVRFLRPDIAIVHWSWMGNGDKNPDGTARQRRYGMMSMVAEKRAGRWLVVASQNDNSFPGLPPEFEGITPAMAIPDQLGPQPSDKSVLDTASRCAGRVTTDP